jgi:3-phenylpropionate/cinnamic acid dioxygenase small subunit
MFGEGAYNEVMHFLLEEAHLLDEGRFTEWMKLLTNDVVCTMPVRQSVHRTAGAGFSNSMNWLREDFGSLTFKVKRLHTDSAFNEDPPSRVRRIITNLRLHETKTPGEYFAQSYLLLRRNRGDAHATDTLSARRDDVLRRTGDGWRLARRTVLLDQSVLGMANLAVFL